MTVITNYICDKCGVSYRDESAARQCEAKHLEIYTPGMFYIQKWNNYPTGAELPNIVYLPFRTKDGEFKIVKALLNTIAAKDSPIYQDFTEQMTGNSWWLNPTDNSSAS